MCLHIRPFVTTLNAILPPLSAVMWGVPLMPSKHCDLYE